MGGGTVGDGLDQLYTDPSVDLVSFDVYSSPDVVFIGDGHAIPWADGGLDGVIIQAVLEHVLAPGTALRWSVDYLVRALTRPCEWVGSSRSASSG